MLNFAARLVSYFILCALAFADFCFGLRSFPPGLKFQYASMYRAIPSAIFSMELVFFFVHTRYTDAFSMLHIMAGQLVKLRRIVLFLSTLFFYSASYITKWP